MEATRKKAVVFDDFNFHLLKVDSEDLMYDLITCRKSFEYRRNDREFAEGDVLCLVYWNGLQFTNSYVFKVVDYIHYGGHYGVPIEYCIMAISEFRRYGLGLSNDELVDHLILNYYDATHPIPEQ
ncbi:DUF3850 domain-containing protein [Fibrisoma montanum]|uniref:DUF3850 domain-containing protein n=1 Tax=Fibrisoma montanum TaxID=2305895 RepID=A0A418M6A4_9BACT|nr:DUF3850 domain-containing protein [Fibrisoma montanum]RIV21361.1 DUF3850 domain-containing protein [Fibrisoma montanum]